MKIDYISQRRNCIVSALQHSCRDHNLNLRSQFEWGRLYAVWKGLKDKEGGGGLKQPHQTGPLLFFRRLWDWYSRGIFSTEEMYKRFSARAKSSEMWYDL